MHVSLPSPPLMVFACIHKQYNTICTLKWVAMIGSFQPLDNIQSQMHPSRVCLHLPLNWATFFTLLWTFSFFYFFYPSCLFFVRLCWFYPWLFLCCLWGQHPRRWVIKSLFREPQVESNYLCMKITTYNMTYCIWLRCRNSITYTVNQGKERNQCLKENSFFPRRHWLKPC